MTPYEIPLSSEAQRFTIAMGARSYVLEVRWNAVSVSWVLDIASETGQALVQGTPLVTGVDLLKPFGYLNFGGALYVQTDHALDEPPTDTNLGATSHLYFVTE